VATIMADEPDSPT